MCTRNSMHQANISLNLSFLKSFWSKMRSLTGQSQYILSPICAFHRQHYTESCLMVLLMLSIVYLSQNMPFRVPYQGTSFKYCLRSFPALQRLISIKRHFSYHKIQLNIFGERPELVFLSEFLYFSNTASL